MRSQETSPASGRLSPQLSQELANLLRQEEELKARLAVKEPWYWLREATKTRDEQDAENPYKPFPEWPFFLPLFAYLDRESVAPIKKSRTLMVSWAVAAWAAHKAFNRPATKVVFQSKDQDRATHDVEYAKILWENSIEPLRRLWKLAKPLELQPRDRFTLANKSELVAIPGTPDKIRSEHPTVFVMEEAGIIEEAEASYNTAVATKCPHIILIGTAGPGWFADFTQLAPPIDWPY